MSKSVRSLAISPVLLSAFAVIALAGIALIIIGYNVNKKSTTAVVTVPATRNSPYTGWSISTNQNLGISIRFPANWSQSSGWIGPDSGSADSHVIFNSDDIKATQDQVVFVEINSVSADASLSTPSLKEYFPGLLTAQSECQFLGGIAYDVVCSDPIERSTFPAGSPSRRLTGYRIRFTALINQKAAQGNPAQSTGLLSPSFWVIPFTSDKTPEEHFVILSTGEQFTTNESVEAITDLMARSIQTVP
jgi:hypothetical protein